jgi:hypothetical protein
MGKVDWLWNEEEIYCPKLMYGSTNLNRGFFPGIYNIFSFDFIIVLLYYNRLSLLCVP